MKERFDIWLNSELEKLEIPENKRASTLIQRTGASKQTVYNWLKDAAEPRFEYTLKIQLALAELQKESSVKELEAAYIAHVSEWDSSTPLNAGEIEIRLLDEIKLAAGDGIEPGNEVSKKVIRMSRATLRKRGVEASNAAVVMVSGDSMYPRYSDGSYVYIDEGQKSIRDGRRYAIRQNGRLRIKELHQLPDKIKIVSANPDKITYPDEFAFEDDDFVVIGKVWHYSGFED